ncbi:hypothetical protein CPB86DRAFT_433591 [Serendipita vermifera]|nr:hypothetical protein CPB86DRAFT_433591 [Serendipita vermifera]
MEQTLAVGTVCTVVDAVSPAKTVMPNRMNYRHNGCSNFKFFCALHRKFYRGRSYPSRWRRPWPLQGKKEENYTRFSPRTKDLSNRKALSGAFGIYASKSSRLLPFGTSAPAQSRAVSVETDCVGDEMRSLFCKFERILVDSFTVAHTLPSTDATVSAMVRLTCAADTTLDNITRCNESP